MFGLESGLRPCLDRNLGLSLVLDFSLRKITSPIVLVSAIAKCLSTSSDVLMTVTGQHYYASTFWFCNLLAASFEKKS